MLSCDEVKRRSGRDGGMEYLLRYFVFSCVDLCGKRLGQGGWEHELFWGTTCKIVELIAMLVMQLSRLYILIAEDLR